MEISENFICKQKVDIKIKEKSKKEIKKLSQLSLKHRNPLIYKGFFVVTVARVYCHRAVTTVTNYHRKEEKR